MAKIGMNIVNAMEQPSRSKSGATPKSAGLCREDNVPPKNTRGGEPLRATGFRDQTEQCRGYECGGPANRLRAICRPTDRVAIFAQNAPPHVPSRRECNSFAKVSDFNNDFSLPVPPRRTGPQRDCGKNTICISHVHRATARARAGCACFAVTVTLRNCRDHIMLPNCLGEQS